MAKTYKQDTNKIIKSAHPGARDDVKKGITISHGTSNEQ
jgi:hypothetical protein